MIKLITGMLEVIVLIACVYFGYQWTQNPTGNYEPWLFLGGLTFFGLDVFRRYKVHFIKREGKSFTPGELVKHSENLRERFQKEIYKCRAENLRKDIIIRHVNRMDSYPEVDERKKGISPWFRAALLDTYHRGILVGLRYGSLMVAPDGYRYRDYKNDEKSDINVFMVGKIPYEFIEDINFDGDEYYDFPHIFCHFAYKGEPYEETVFCEEINMGNGRLYYKEIAEYQSVKDNSVGFGGDYFA